jgi:hypothetical protein
MGNIQLNTIHEIHRVSEAIKLDRDQCMAAVKASGRSLQFMQPEFQDDKAIVQIAMNGDAWAFAYASETLRNDYELVTRAFTMCPNLFGHAGETIKNNGAFIRGLIDRCASHDLYTITEFVPPNVFDASMAEAIVTKCVHTHLGANLAFRKIPPQFWTKELVVVAVKNGNHMAEYMPDALKDDFDVFEAVLQHTRTDTLACFSRDFINDPKHALMAATAYGGIFKDLNLENKGNADILMAAMETSATEFRFASDALKTDRNVVLKAIRMFPFNYTCLSEETKRDPEIAFTAVACDPSTYKYVAEPIFEEPWLQIVALSFSTDYYKRSIVRQHTAWFTLKIAPLVVLFNTTKLFLLASQCVTEEPEKRACLEEVTVVTKKKLGKPKSTKCFLRNLNKDMSPIIAGYFKDKYPLSEFVNQVCAERGITARDLLWGVKDY